jgi:hypothetical protein
MFYFFIVEATFPPDEEAKFDAFAIFAAIAELGSD